MTYIISGFPGVGKSHFTELARNTFLTDVKVLDSDSSKYSWISEGERNPDFPNNYLEEIERNYGKYHFILVSTHKEVRDGLVERDLPFVLFYPEISKREEYLKRYKNRGSSPEFLNLMENRFVEMISDLQHQKGCIHLICNQNQYLSDFFPITKGEEAEKFFNLPDLFGKREHLMAIRKYGRKRQIIKAISELTELSHELMRHYEDKTQSHLDVLGEIADLEQNIIPQLKFIFTEKYYNLTRQQKREKFERILKG